MKEGKNVKVLMIFKGLNGDWQGSSILAASPANGPGNAAVYLSPQPTSISFP